MNKTLMTAIVVIILAAGGYYAWTKMSGGGSEAPMAVDTSDPNIKAFMDAFKPSCEQSMKSAAAANPASGITEDKVPAICDCASGKIVEAMKQKGESMSMTDMVGIMASPDFATAMQSCVTQ